MDGKMVQDGGRYPLNKQGVGGLHAQRKQSTKAAHSSCKVHSVQRASILDISHCDILKAQNNGYPLGTIGCVSLALIQ